MITKTKTRIFSAILITSVFSLIFFLIYPIFQEIKKSSSGILEQKQKLLLLESRVENLEKFKNRYIEIEPDFIKTEELFIKADLPVDFIRFLEKTAKDSNVEAKISLSSSQQTEGQSWKNYPFQAAIQSSFPDFLRFLERLQTSQYLIEIRDLSAASQASGISASISFWVLAK